MRATLEAGRLRRATPSAKRGLLIGQAAPAAGGNHPLLPFPRNCAGERLFRMSGWTLVDYLAWLDRFNTIAKFPGSPASGIVPFWNDPSNRLAARDLFRQLAEKILPAVKIIS